MTYRVIIVDDEPPARKKIARLLSEDPRFHCIGEAGGAEEAAPLIERERPDLLFLDIQMPGASGFDLLNALATDRLPRVIFTTAYDQYALKAFEVHALDYLLKPFDKARFNAALERAAGELTAQADAQAPMRALLAQLAERQPGARRLLLREGGKLFSIETNRVISILAEEKYVRIHTEARNYLHRETISNMEKKLDPTRFARIHRSTLINLDYFAHMEPAGRGDYLVALKDGSKHKLGRNYREPFLRQLEGQ